MTISKQKLIEWVRQQQKDADSKYYWWQKHFKMIENVGNLEKAIEAGIFNL